MIGVRYDGHNFHASPIEFDGVEAGTRALHRATYCDNCGATFTDWLRGAVDACPSPTAGLRRRIYAAAARQGWGEAEFAEMVERHKLNVLVNEALDRLARSIRVVTAANLFALARAFNESRISVDQLRVRALAMVAVLSALKPEPKWWEKAIDTVILWIGDE